jgi:phospholipid/cholesterol/gamma-HCH transport system substrate-binding protein
MRRILATALGLLAAGAFLLVSLGSSSGGRAATYKIELDNAFGLVAGGDFKVSGAKAGTIQSVRLNQKTLHALVTVAVTKSGFASFRSDAFCQSRPQSLIGEYFLDCDPGTRGKVLAPGSLIPITRTQSTIPLDLVQNTFRLPYAQRLSIIVNELGAAVASRSEDLQSALRRADPALAQTDNLLALLARDAHTIRQLNVGADSVITALANSHRQVQRFLIQADRVSSDSAAQASNIQSTWNKLPGFLEQLRPAMAKLGAAADAQDPEFQKLNIAAANLHRLFVDLVPFSRASLPSLRSLGQASVTGKSAVHVATPAVHHLNQFARPTPELAQNLAIVLQALDTRGRTVNGGGAVELDPRSPAGGRGYTGLEALLQYAFNITNTIDYFGPYGHMLGVDLVSNNVCGNYATPATIAQNFAQYNSGHSSTNPRSCYASLGPNQPGVTIPDPSWNAGHATPANPSPCVPDPGGYPEMGYGTRYYGARTNACKLSASGSPAADRSRAKPARPRTEAGGRPGPGGTSAGSQAASNPTQALAQIVSQALGASGPASNPATTGPDQTQQLLNYLLAP